MRPDCANPTRRRLLAAALACAGAAAQKISQRDAQYQGMPKDIRSCGSCSLFQPPHACKAVEGTISSSGWCRLYVAVD